MGNSGRDMVTKKIHSVLRDYGKQVKTGVLVAVVILALVFAGTATGVLPSSHKHLDKRDVEKKIQENKDRKESKDSENREKDIQQKEYLTVDISGMVAKPGVYTVPSGSRLNDVVEMAGGLMPEADINAINRAECVEDGQKLYIPEKGEEEPNFAGATGAAPTGSARTSGQININRADSMELQQINGVGPATAEKIIEYRKANGRFNSIEDIKNVSGIGEKTFEKIKDSITV